uniref:Molybdenum cofactor synthesis 2 n=1 Tax=Malurus cyaneus samueli TaxID=2593467 RepID=A0A8C5UB59_9PASS
MIRSPNLCLSEICFKLFDLISIFPESTTDKNVPKDFIKLKSEKLSVDEVSELVVSPCCGAVSLFIGTQEIIFERQKKVIQLRIMATYTSIAKAVLFLFFPSVVPITEASVIIAVSSPHRAESLEAVTYCINTLKASVPIWKKVCLGTESNLGRCWS